MFSGKAYNNHCASKVFKIRLYWS